MSLYATMKLGQSPQLVFALGITLLFLLPSPGTLGHAMLAEPPAGWVTESTLHGVGEIASSSTCTNPVGCVVENISVGNSPGSLVYDSGDGDVYASNYGSNNVSVMNGTSMVGTASVGIEPSAEAYDAADREVYILDTDCNTTPCGPGNVSVISGTSLAGTVAVGSDPYAIAFDSGNGEVYVGSEEVATVSILSGTSVIGGVSMGGQPNALAYDSANGDIYAVDLSMSDVWVISGSTVVARVPVGTMPQFATFDSGNGDVYVSNFGSNNVSVISGTSVVATIQVGSEPEAIAYNVVNGDVYVSHPSNAISVISGTTLVGSVSAGAFYHAFACDRRNGYEYVVNDGSNNVSVVSGTSLLGTIAVGNQPDAIEYDDGNGYLYVANSLSDTVSVIAPSGGGGGPTLSSVTVSPASTIVPLNGTQSFTATPSCVGGACAPGTTYSWTLTNGLGTLNSGSGNPVVFTAGNKDGNVTLFVNATLSGTVKQSGPVSIDITNTVPLLSSVSVSPFSITVSTGSTQTFTASPACTSGPCPSGTTYSWTVTNNLGTLVSSTGNPVTFKAGPGAGKITLFVNATLNGVARQSAPATIIIASTTLTLSSVLIRSTGVGGSGSALGNGGCTLSVAGGGSGGGKGDCYATFTATPTCSGGSCPSGVAYSWTLTNQTLGSLNSTTGDMVKFTVSDVVGGSAGNVSLFVNATLNGRTVQSSPAIIHVTSSSSAPSSAAQDSSLWLWLVIVAAAVVVIAVTLLLARKKRRGSGGQGPGPIYGMPQTPTGQYPPVQGYYPQYPPPR